MQSNLPFLHSSFVKFEIHKLNISHFISLKINYNRQRCSLMIIEKGAAKLHSFITFDDYFSKTVVKR